MGGLLGYLYAFCMPSLAELENSLGIVDVEYIIISSFRTEAQGLAHDVP